MQVAWHSLQQAWQLITAYHGVQLSQDDNTSMALTAASHLLELCEAQVSVLHLQQAPAVGLSLVDLQAAQ
jgi:hypothetical protein